METHVAPVASVKPHPARAPGTPEITPPGGSNVIRAEACAEGADAASATAVAASHFHIPDRCILFLLIRLSEQRHGLACEITFARPIYGAQTEFHHHPGRR